MWREIITGLHRGCPCRVSCLYFAMCDKGLASSELTKRLSSNSAVGFKEDRPSSLMALQNCMDRMGKSSERPSTAPVKTLHFENQAETAKIDSLDKLALQALSMKDDTKDSMQNLSRDVNSRRADYLQWPEYFMALAFLAAKRSKDPCSQVGACIVDPYHKIVGLGYNGFPTGCSDDEFPWRKGGRTDLNSKYMYVCHAEMNAILNKISADVRGCTMYVGLFPCAECAKLIIQAGISQVVYMSDKHANKPETIASKRMFNAAGVTYQQYIPKEQKIVIDFSEINWNDMTQVPPSPKKS